MKGRVEVNLLGTSFTLSSDQESSYLNRVVKEYSLLVKRVQSETGVHDPLKCSILAGILATDQRLKQNDSDRESSPFPKDEVQAVERITGQLIQKIEKCLAEDQ